jgi:hypothetical protein
MRRFSIQSVGPNFFSFMGFGVRGRDRGIFKKFLFPMCSHQVPKEFPMVFPIVIQFYPICISTSMYVDCKRPKGSMTMLLFGGGGGVGRRGASIQDCSMSQKKLWGANESGGFFRNETQRVHGHSIGGRRGPIWQWLFFEWSGDMDERCFMCAIPCTICCKLDVGKKQNTIYKICNNSKASLKLRNKVHEMTMCH